MVFNRQTDYSPKYLHVCIEINTKLCEIQAASLQPPLFILHALGYAVVSVQLTDRQHNGTKNEQGLMSQM